MQNQFAKLLFLFAFVLINLQSQCGRNDPAQQQFPTVGDVQLIAQGPTQLKGQPRTIQLRMTTKLKEHLIDANKLELRFSAASKQGKLLEGVKLLYNNQPVEDIVSGKIPGSALPPVGQPINFQLNPGPNSEVGFVFVIYYADKMMSESVDFYWTDGYDPQGEALLHAISDKNTTLAEIEEVIKQNAPYIN